MSLYNSLFGCHPLAMFILRTLGLHVTSVPRFRDVYLQGGKIVVYTRTGGGNRDVYDNPTDDLDEPSNVTLRNHPLYERDADCEIDSTYANFYFSFPEAYRSELEMLQREKPTLPPAELWRKVLE